MRHRYQSLEDFLITNPLTVDCPFDDGGGEIFPVKGREIDATILFADITSFTARTLELTPAETLFFVNNFFSWISAEALRGRPGIVDKYIGDELMLVFSTEFGSDDPFVDAVQAARFMAQNDFLGFCPHIGLASGRVIVGYVGTPLKYSCSVFGSPVALAARCAGVTAADDEYVSSTIVFPAAEWGSRDFDAVLPPQRLRNTDGSEIVQPHGWEMLEPRTVDLKNLGGIEVREIVSRMAHIPMQSATERAKEGLAELKKAKIRAALDLVRRVEATQS